MKELIKDYQNKITTINKMIKGEFNHTTITRLVLKRSCYRTFLTDLERLERKLFEQKNK